MKVKQSNQVDITTEQSILNAAEQVFLEKGYNLAKTTEIANLAGVNHAMLHYYFRTKENLFNKVFEQKAQLFAGSFESLLDQEMPFFEKIKLGIETHFDFLAANPKLPVFIIQEVITNEKNKDMLKKILIPKVTRVIEKIEQAIEEEKKRGTITSVLALDLLLNIVSLNIFAFTSVQVFFGTNVDFHNQAVRMFLQHRKQNNVDLILKGLKN